VILGCGVDLIEVGRIERELTRRGQDPFDDLFTPDERAWCRARRRPAEGYALGFAAKEAVVKALGTGLVGRMAWTDIRIDWEPRSRAKGHDTGSSGGAGGPAVSLHGETRHVAAELGVKHVHLTVALRRPGREINPGLISRGVALAAAWVVLEAHERRDPDGS
jgi:holo-[acyl-carrier protein] synthase